MTDTAILKDLEKNILELSQGIDALKDQLQTASNDAKSELFEQLKTQRKHWSECVALRDAFCGEEK